MTTATENYRQARDQLLALREDHERAVAEFAFPDVGDTFNWAIDWFDIIARGNDQPALIIVEEDGSAHRALLRRDRRRSDQVAAWLKAPTRRRQGRPGHPHARQPGPSCGT
jgi:acetyl-CoA synthetase